MNKNTYTLNEKEFKINGDSTTIVDKEGNELFRIDINKGCLKIERKSSDKEVLDLLNNTLDDESYEDINNNINLSVSINNSAIAAYVEGINSGLNFMNKYIDHELFQDVTEQYISDLLQDVIKQDIIKYININIE